jgi:hypothetical protein
VTFRFAVSGWSFGSCSCKQAARSLVASLFLVFKGAPAGLAALVGRIDRGCRKCTVGLARIQAGIAGGATLMTAMYAGVALKWLWFALALYVALARLKLGRCRY